MALEQTLNKVFKIKGIITGIVPVDNTVEKWTFTTHLRSAVKATLFKKNDTVKSGTVVKSLLKVSKNISDPFEFESPKQKTHQR